MLTFEQIENANSFPASSCFCWGGIHKAADGFCKNTDNLIYVCSKEAISSKKFFIIYTLCSQCLKGCACSYYRSLYLLTEKEAFTLKLLKNI